MLRLVRWLLVGSFVCAEAKWRDGVWVFSFVCLMVIIIMKHLFNLIKKEEEINSNNSTNIYRGGSRL